MGLISATLSTLLFIPLIYVVLHRRDPVFIPAQSSTGASTEASIAIRRPDHREGNRQITVE